MPNTPNTKHYNAKHTRHQTLQCQHTTHTKHYNAKHTNIRKPCYTVGYILAKWTLAVHCKDEVV